jgi:hypothetical protein
MLGQAEGVKRGDPDFNSFSYVGTVLGSRFGFVRGRKSKMIHSFAAGAAVVIIVFTTMSGDRFDGRPFVARS